MTQVITNNRPRLSDAIGGLANVIRGRSDKAAADEDSKARARASAVMQYAIARKANPQQLRAVRSQLAQADPTAAQYIPNIEDLPPDEFEEAKRQIQIEAANRMKGGTATNTDPTIVFNTDEVGKEPFRQQQLSDIIKTNDPTNPQTGQARIEAKMDPTADVALREKTEGPLRVAQTQQATADAAFTAGPKTARETAEATFTAGPRTTETLASAREKNATARGKNTPPGGVPADGSGPIGEAFLNTLPPSEQRLIKSIAGYFVDPTKVASLRNPKDAGSERNRLIKEVLQYDPSYDMTQFASRNKLRQDFNSGMGARNIRSINTAVKHLASLSEAVDKMDNSEVQIANTVGNFFSKQTGSPKVTNFQNAANAVESEMASVFKGTGATDQEIKAWRENLKPNMSPEQLHGAINTMIELMGGRLAALASQYQQGMGKPKDFQILSDGSRKTLSKFGIDPDALENGNVVPLGGGGAPSAPPAPSGAGGGRMSKEQVNKATGERRTVYSDDGGATWHP